MRQSLVDIASTVLKTTSNRHSRINVVQSAVDTRGSPPLMCMLVLWGAVWQVDVLVLWGTVWQVDVLVLWGTVWQVDVLVLWGTV